MEEPVYQAYQAPPVYQAPPIEQAPDLRSGGDGQGRRFGTGFLLGSVLGGIGGVLHFLYGIGAFQGQGAVALALFWPLFVGFEILVGGALGGLACGVLFWLFGSSR